MFQPSWIILQVLEISLLVLNILHFYFKQFLIVFYSCEQFSSTKNRMLLWHGSRLTNWAGILSQGDPL